MTRGSQRPDGDRVVRSNVGFLIFDGVDVLDLAGPFEVFLRTRMAPGVESRLSEDSAPYRVFAVASSADAVRAAGGLSISAHYTFDDAPPIDILIVPGGMGTRVLVHDVETLEWIQDVAGRARTVASVCTGALLLAAAGLLRRRRVTTHWGAVELLRSLDTSVTIERGARVVDDGVITAGGIACGIDMALHVVESEHGPEIAEDTALYIAYDRCWRPKA